MTSLPDPLKDHFDLIEDYIGDKQFQRYLKFKENIYGITPVTKSLSQIRDDDHSSQGVIMKSKESKRSKSSNSSQQGLKESAGKSVNKLEGKGPPSLQVVTETSETKMQGVRICG